MNEIRGLLSVLAEPAVRPLLSRQIPVMLGRWYLGEGKGTTERGIRIMWQGGREATPAEQRLPLSGCRPWGRSGQTLF